MTSRFGFFECSELRAWDNRLDIIEKALDELGISSDRSKIIPKLPNAGTEIQYKYEKLGYRLRNALNSQDSEFQKNAINYYKQSIGVIRPFLVKKNAKATNISAGQKQNNCPLAPVENSNDEWSNITTRPRSNEAIPPSVHK